jgi:serine/threonine-protein kinase RsbT
VSAPVIEKCEMKIDTEDDIILVRRKVRDLAQACRFSVFAASAITTAASELARNVWVHAGRGSATIERLLAEGRAGIRLEFKDDGPGIPDVPRVLAGGYSTAKSMGLGLSGSRRLVDEFAIESVPGQGTKVMLVKWAPF